MLYCGLSLCRQFSISKLTQMFRVFSVDDFLDFGTLVYYARNRGRGD